MGLDKKIVINMLSSADKVEEQSVGSAYLGQANLVKEGASDLFTAEINGGKKADIIHSHTIDPQNYLKMKNNRNANVYYVHSLLDMLNGSMRLPKALFSVFKKYVINFYKAAGYLIVVSPIFMRELEKYGIAKGKMVYIPNYVSKEQFHVKSVEQRNAIHEQHGIKTGEFVVIGVGQVQTRKGMLDFADVARRLPGVRSARRGDFSFGKTTDGYEELGKIAKGPPANVQSLDIIPRSDMNDVCSIADMLFVPFYDELFPMATLEVTNLHRSMVLHSLELYEDILSKKYQMVDDNDSFAGLIRRLHEDPAYYACCAANNTYINEYYSRENVLSIWKEFYTRVHEELQERKREQRSAASVF